MLLVALAFLLLLSVCPSFAEMEPADGIFVQSSDTAKRPEPPPELLRRSYALGRSWFLNATRPDGTFLYYYDPMTGRRARRQDVLRELMASRLLAAMARENPELLPLHRKNLETAFGKWFREDQKGRGFFMDGGASELGANAMGLRLLAASPELDKHRDRAEALVQSILALQNEDGSFEPFYVIPSYPFDRDYCLAFYSGEAVLALMEYYDATGDETALKAAKKSQDYYLDEYVTHLKENYYPAYVPWQTMALWHLFKTTGETRYADAAFVLSDKLLEIQETKGDHPGRFFNRDFSRYGGTHSSSDGVFTEGLAHALDMAQLTGDKAREKRYREAIALSVRNLASLQYLHEPAKVTGTRVPVLGAFRSRDNDGRVRIDSTQHILDAYRKILEVW